MNRFLVELVILDSLHDITTVTTTARTTVAVVISALVEVP